MKKHRKQSVNVFGQKQLLDVPVDNELYKADNRDDYQRTRSKGKHVSLDEVILADESADVTEAYEEAQLMVSLHDALRTLNEKEHQLVAYLFYDGLTERKAAAITRHIAPSGRKAKEPHHREAQGQLD